MGLTFTFLLRQFLQASGFPEVAFLDEPDLPPELGGLGGVANRGFEVARIGAETSSIYVSSYSCVRGNKESQSNA
jgi:hypothetical protein